MPTRRSSVGSIFCVLKTPKFCRTRDVDKPVDQSTTSFQAIHVLPRRHAYFDYRKRETETRFPVPGSHFVHVWNISHYDHYLSSKCQASSFTLINIDSEKIIGQHTPLTYVCIPPWWICIGDVGPYCSQVANRGPAKGAAGFKVWHHNPMTMHYNSR